MTIFLQILIFATIILMVWSAFVGVATFKVMKAAKKKHSKFRKSDILLLLGLFCFSVGSAILLFIYPGLIYTIPAALAVIEIAISVILYHLSDIQLKNWHRLHTHS